MNGVCMVNDVRMVRMEQEGLKEDSRAKIEGKENILFYLTG